MLERFRTLADRPVLDRLRAFESLPVLGRDEADALLAMIDVRHDRGWLRPAFARLIPAASWHGFILHETLSFAHELIENEARHALGKRWGELLVDAIAAGAEPAPYLARLERDVIDSDLAGVPDAAWRSIAACVGDRDREVRSLAVYLAVVAKRITPRALVALRAELAEPSEQLLGAVALAGPRVASVAPALVHGLASPAPAIRLMAARAAGALRDRSLVPYLDRAQQREDGGQFNICGVRAMMRLALWQLTGEPLWFERALDDTSDSPPFQQLRHALDTAPADELLASVVVRLGRRSAWRGLAYRIAARFGERAWSLVSRIDPPVDDDRDGLVAFQIARARAELIDATELAAELEPLLPGSLDAWDAYVRLALDTPAWLATIRGAIAAADGCAIDALRHAPAIALRFLPELAARGHDSLVERLWRDTATDVFWAYARPGELRPQGAVPPVRWSQTPTAVGGG